MGHKITAPAGMIHMRAALVRLGRYGPKTAVAIKRQVTAGEQMGLRVAAYRPLGERGVVAFTYESDLRRALKRMEKAVEHVEKRDASPDVGREMHASQVEVDELDQHLDQLDTTGVIDVVSAKLDELATQLAKVQQQLAALCRAWDINA